MRLTFIVINKYISDVTNQLFMQHLIEFHVITYLLLSGSYSFDIQHCTFSNGLEQIDPKSKVWS